MAATATPATAALARAGVEHTLHGYQHDPSNLHFGLEAVTALGQDPNRVGRTATEPAAHRQDLVDRHVDARRHAVQRQRAGADAERTTGYVRGGISPLGQKKALPTVVDASAQRFTTIMVSGGRRGLQVELAPDDLVALVRGSYGSIGR